MAKKTNWEINIDKLKVCLNTKPELYTYLQEHYTRLDPLTNHRILEEDDFNLVFIEEDEQKMTAVVNVRDIDGYLRLGTFVFSHSAKYKDKAFFTFENAALYTLNLKVNEEKYNHICDLSYICDFYGMDFNNITELELAFDTDYNYIKKTRRMIKNEEEYDLYINGKKVLENEKLDGYGEYFGRTRKELSKEPTLYFSQSKETDMRMRIYDKAKELEENSPYKSKRFLEWLGWKNTDIIYRVEVVLHNTNIRDFFDRYGTNLCPDTGSHDNALALLCLPEVKFALFLDSSDRMVYFRNKRTREKISLVEVASGI